MAKNDPKILTLDIETKPAKAYVWRLWDENISQEQLIEPGGMICFGAKWLGEKKLIFFSDWEHGHKACVEAMHALLSEADAVVTYNGDRFDLPKLQGEFLLYSLTPPPPPTSIDLYKTVKKLGFIMNKLSYIGPLLNIGEKMKHEGFKLWRLVMEGDTKAQTRMKRYCLQDVKLTEELYNKVRAYIKNHPHLGTEAGAETCGACGSSKLHSRGYRRTRMYRIQRLQCQNCGSWQDGRREKLS